MRTTQGFSARFPVRVKEVWSRRGALPLVGLGAVILGVQVRVTTGPTWRTPRATRCAFTDRRVGLLWINRAIFWEAHAVEGPA